MTTEKDDIQITNRIAVTLDICSSSQIIEDLIKTTNIKVWRDLLISMKDFLVTESPKYNAKIYKFIGDGWIILFEQTYSAANLLKFIKCINDKFEKQYKEMIYPNLDTPPEISGLTFGIDEGQLVLLTMQENNEFVGRPINIACRLQGAINKMDIKTGYRVLMSHRLFNFLRINTLDYYFEETDRPLRNISEGRNFKCYRICISDNQLIIVRAIYGTTEKEIEVTFQYAKQIKNNKLDVVVSNEIAENDPDRGKLKTLKIKYFHAGKLFDKKFIEGSRIQLP